MADTTMGQRIAERRRLLSISQEALGEKMGVSRQAISKWESDGAVPEIDKIIAMSRLFGVSVGWILGTEEPPEEESPNPVEIAKEPPRQNRTVMLLSGACVILAAAVLGLWYGQARLRSALESSRFLVSTLQAENSRMEQKLDTLSRQIQSLADSREEANAMFSQVYCSVNAADDGKQALVYVTLVPKKWSNGDEVELTVLRDSKKVEQQPCVWDGTAFSGVLLLPAENGYQYYCTVIHADGSRDQQSIENEQAENLARELQVNCSAGMEGYQLALLEGNLTVTDAYVSLAMPKCLDGPEHGGVNWEKAEFVLYKNGQVIDRVQPAGLLTAGDSSKTFHAAIEEFSLRFDGMSDGDSLELWLEAELSNGMTGRGFVDGWAMEDGDIIKMAVVAGQ